MPASCHPGGQVRLDRGDRTGVCRSRPLSGRRLHGDRSHDHRRGSSGGPRQHRRGAPPGRDQHRGAARPPRPTGFRLVGLHASAKSSTFTEAGIREMRRLAALHDAINRGQGYPDFPAPGEVKEAARRAIGEDHNQYPITWGDPTFRRAIAAKYAADYGMIVDPETEICVTCGSTEAMAASFLGILDEGDEVVVFEPFYESYNP